MLEIALPQARTALAEARERELYERNRFRKTAAERLREVESEIERQQEQMIRADSQIERTLLVSPVDGVLKNLKLNTIGGVVAPREPIVEIVPSDEGTVEPGEIVLVDGHAYLAHDTPVRLVDDVAAEGGRPSR